MKNKEEKIYTWENWILNGILWGLFMFIVLGLVYPYIVGEEISAEGVFIQLILWLVGGLVFGYTMKIVAKRIIKNKTKDKS